MYRRTEQEGPVSLGKLFGAQGVDFTEGSALMFLPPNTTSLLQPLDKGIIWSLKRSYRKCLVTQLAFDIDRRHLTSITIKTKVQMLYGSWNDLRQSTIRNCSADAGFVLLIDEPRREDLAEEPDESTWHQLALPNVSFEDFVSADDNLAVAPELKDWEIIDCVLLPCNESSSDSKDDIEEFSKSSTGTGGHGKEAVQLPRKTPHGWTWKSSVLHGHGELHPSQCREKAPIKDYIILQINFVHSANTVAPFVN